MTFHIDANVPAQILGDPYRLEHVLGNLLSNAIKFSDLEAKIEIHVSYGSRVAGYVTFSVKDYGPGMSSEEQKMLFQPFRQIRPGELQKGRGSGLSLSICKEIIQLHKGTIGCVSRLRSAASCDINSTKEGGSEFFFNIEGLAVAENDEVVVDNFFCSIS